MRKAQRRASIPLSVKLPPKRIREKFLVIYELQGCQKASDFLTHYYGVKRMHIILNGRKFGRGKAHRWVAYYFENKAYFTKEGLKRRIVLHEFFHHLVEVMKLEMPRRTEEKEANNYAKIFVKDN